MKKVKLETGTESKVQQQYRDETNVSTIVNKFLKTGQLPLGTNQQPIYIDHNQYGDFTEMLNQVTEVQQNFAKLPSSIRNRFQNKPAKLLEFLQHEENRKEAEALGLIKTPELPKKLKEDIIDDIVEERSPRNSSTPEGSEASQSKSAKGAKKG